MIKILELILDFENTNRASENSDFKLDVIKSKSKTRSKKLKLTRKLPRIELIQINLSNNRNRNRLRSAFLDKVMHNQFFIRGMESKSRRQHQIISSHYELIFNLQKLKNSFALKL